MNTLVPSGILHSGFESVTVSNDLKKLN